MSSLKEYIKFLIKEDPMGFVHDLSASDKFGENFFGGKIDKAAGRDIKRAFAKNADHQWLSTLDTVHWVPDVYGLEALTGKGKDELSTTMALPGDPLRSIFNHPVGLWVRGRITLATDQQDTLYSGRHGDYDAPKEGSEEEVAHRDKSSGRNKRPTMSKDYSRYGQLQKGNEYSEKMARNIPYVLDQSTWDPHSSDSTNEALVDNWRPIAIVATGEAAEVLSKNVEQGNYGLGKIKKIFELSKKFGIPIVDSDRNELWSPGEKKITEEVVRKYIREVLLESKLSGHTIEGVLSLLDGYASNTWIFFDTETTGMHPDSAQLTEIGAIAIDPKDWNSTSQVLGEFNEKIKLTDETERLLNDPESKERQAWEKGNQGARSPLKDPQAVLSMTRYGEQGRDYGDEQEILDEFFEFVESFPNPLMIAQNASFDLKFLSVRSEGKMIKHPVLDTQQLMEMYLVPLLKTQTKAEEGDPAAQDLLDKLYVNKGNWGYHSVSMGVVSKAYDINIEDWHNALADVKMMMEMYKNVVQTIRQGMNTDISQEHGKAVIKRNRRKKR